jgi:hypothetical protein
MAKGKKTGGRDIKPGQVLNPIGGGAITPAVREIRKITMDHLQEVAEVILDANFDELAKIAESPTESTLKVWLARSAVSGIRAGNMANLDSILNRVLGKPKERFEHTGKDGERLNGMTDEEIETRMRDLASKMLSDDKAGHQ